MEIIDIITLFLLVTPFYAVITDFYVGKIKNYFVFSALLFSIIITFFINGFYLDKQNIIGIIISVFFGYLFYKNNKWGAGDGKYIILLGLNSIIISFLQGFSINIISYLFLSIFSLTFLYCLFFLIKNIKKIIKIKFIINHSINFLDLFYNAFLIYLFVFLITYLLGNNYNYAIIFLSIILLYPFVNKYSCKNSLKILIIIFGIFLLFFNLNYFSIFSIVFFLYFFSLLEKIFNQIFDIIDVRKINLYDIKQGDILTQNSIDYIFKDISYNFQVTPLQGNEVFRLIDAYKTKNQNPEIEIYNGFKMGFLMYVGYFFLIIFFMSKL